MPQDELRLFYAQADVLLLTSTREGWPNVVLESMACGTPVVAVDVGAVREILTDARFGRILPDANAQELSAAVAGMLRTLPSRDDVRRHAAGFDWATVCAGQWNVIEQALGIKPPPRAVDAARSQSRSSASPAPLTNPFPPN